MSKNKAKLSPRKLRSKANKAAHINIATFGQSKTPANPPSDKPTKLPPITELLSLIQSGESIRAISIDKGINYSTLYNYLFNGDNAARTHDARALACSSQDEAALQGIQDSEDSFQLAKANMAAQHIRWRAGRLSKLYSEKVQHETDSRITVIVDRSAAGGPVIDVTPTSK